MIIGYHLVWTAYGWWLPNDPRGSWSDEIRVERIANLGEAHYGRKQVQPLPSELREFYHDAAGALKHELLRFRNADVPVIAESLRTVIDRERYTCYACAIMPDHVHMLTRKHKHHAETMIEHFQEKSRDALREANRRPADHPVWGGPGWKGFLNTQDDVHRVIRYIELHPVKEGYPRQVWDFVTPYDGWLPGRWTPWRAKR